MSEENTGTESEVEVEDKVHINKKETYIAAVSAAGKKSVNNGDEVAAALAGIEIHDLYKVAANFLKSGSKHDVGITEDELNEKYGHLNVGMQRMSLGNRLRAACTSEKNAYVEVDDLVVYVDENFSRTSQVKLKEVKDENEDAA